MFFITCPLLDLERKKNGEKNAGTLLINKAALLSGEVEQVCFYPQGHSSDFRSSRVVNLETFCEGNQADLNKTKTRDSSDSKKNKNLHTLQRICVLVESEVSPWVFFKCLEASYTGVGEIKAAFCCVVKPIKGNTTTKELYSHPDLLIMKQSVCQSQIWTVP